MELACTKKLLDYLGVKAEKVSDDVEPLFQWTANLLVVNRRKTLVAAHGASRCGFVIYGLRAKQLPKLPELIREGIRALLESEYVRPDIIEQYLHDCGQEVMIRANSSRSLVANCNKVCERVKLFTEVFETGAMFQKSLLPWLNNDIVSIKDYYHPYDALIGELVQRYGPDIQCCRVAELEVELKLHTPCKRIIRVPANLNCYQLHRVLQGVFEWKDCHLHHFVTKRDVYSRPLLTVCPNYVLDDLYEVDHLDSTAVTVGELFGEHCRADYEYDFGDDWQHTIRLRQFIEDCPQVWPYCIYAVGDAPMEDCGGASGFEEIVKIMGNPAHPQYREITDWVQGTWWNPLDVDLINRRIRNVHRRHLPVM